jgi:uncharacterized protein
MKKESQCFWDGWIRDENDLGYPLPQGISVEGEWVDEKLIVEKDVMIPMRDGVKLAANIYRPNKSEKFPVIMSFTSYTKDIFGWGKTWGVYHHRISEATSFESADPGFWVPQDYVVILVDNRGYGNSEGQRLGERSGEDFYDGIEWAGTQEWTNGNVGMIGVSNLGRCQWFAAQLKPPHLKAIAPWEATTYLPTPRFGGIREFGFDKHRVGGVPLKAQLGQSIPAVTPPPSLDFRKITVPALICVTWSDQELHTRGTLWGYQTISSEHKWLYTHGGRKWARFYDTDAQAFQKQFFDHFLKGTDSRILKTPRVRLEVRETLDKFTVRYEDEFPIARTEYKKLYLDTDIQRDRMSGWRKDREPEGQIGTLDLLEAKKEGSISYDSTSAKDRAMFDYTFQQDTELTGHMKLKVWASPEHSDDMDLFITLRKLDAKGDEVLFDSCHAPLRFPVAFGWLRLSKRQIDPERSTPWQPIQTFAVEEKVKPGEIVPTEIEIMPSSTLFRKGETLRLIISGKTQARSTRYEYEDINKGKHTIYTGGKYDSYLQVPVIPPASKR